MELAVENSDLIWELDSFSQRQRAIDFVMGFENKLCVFSESVSQLYTNYNIFFPKEEGHHLVILPNPYASHDVFHGIPENAVAPTGLNIIAGDMIGKEGLYLLIPFKGEKTRYRAVPLHVGLRVINQRRPGNKPLLPVLKKGDLRELEAKTPCLHLHCIHLDKLQNRLSMLEVQGIQRVIVQRMDAIT
ncbi:hypothetical protein KOI40_09815 [Aestuariicella sp. G3-2]|uniref:hypothetical protein n=1 Tax=Pseudomaricurvus albidus TaxID=2842452 RepID=UPI001C0AB85E|nr:hypothetical protein [Aestuariicella albida]